MFKFINKSKDVGEKFKELASYFYPFAKEQLGFQEDPTVELAHDDDNSQNPLGSTAYYDPNAQKVVIFTSGRHLKDILRSFSHELVHHGQNCRGEFRGGIKTEEGYAQNDKYLREMEKEAYLKGNMIFRDWEDSYKTKKGVQHMNESKFKKAIDPEYDIEAVAHKRSVSREKFAERMGIKFDLTRLSESYELEEEEVQEDIEGDTQEEETTNLEKSTQTPLMESYGHFRDAMRPATTDFSKSVYKLAHTISGDENHLLEDLANYLMKGDGVHSENFSQLAERFDLSVEESDDGEFSFKSLKTNERMTFHASELEWGGYTTRQETLFESNEKAKRALTSDDISYINKRRSVVNEERLRKFGKFGKFDLDKLKG